MTWRPTLGAIWNGSGAGTRFRVWAPEAQGVELVIESGVAPEATPMERGADGHFELTRADVVPGTRYRYRVDGRGPFPDPASRFQPVGVHGPSEVIDPRDFEWTDTEWHGLPRERLVLYELHVGTFTAEGTFQSAMRRLPWLVELGVTAVLLMPVSDFPGTRNWGYDGVAPFAPARCYGSPNDLRAFVNAAHRAGLAVHLDVVYNHLGPDGAYQGTFSRQYYSQSHDSPWGQGINYDGPGSESVRRYVVENALHWVHDYHIDGLRLDATHAITDDSPVPIVAEVAEAVQGSTPVGHEPRVVIAEDHRNAASMIRDRTAGGWGLDGVWADDFHHEIRVALSGDRDGYFIDYTGSAAEIATTVRDGWFFQGQRSRYAAGPRGSDPHGIPLDRFVICLQNHDQVGNRAFGERLHHDVEACAYRAATVLLLLALETPLLFMGQEWAASSPFRFFTDHNAELGRAVTAGRRREFRRFAKFADEASAATIPDPQALATFESSRLDWSEITRESHEVVLRLYRRLLALRATEPALGAIPSSGSTRVADADDRAIVLRREAAGGTVVAVVRLRGAGRTAIPRAGVNRWELVLTTEDAEFALDAKPITVALNEPAVELSRPGAVVLRSVTRT